MGADTETHLIGHKNLAPPLVCLTACESISPGSTGQTYLATQADGDIDSLLSAILHHQTISVWHNAAFDLAVLIVNKPEWATQVFSAIAEGRVRCTRIREKLLWLTTIGDVENIKGIDGTLIKGDYSLAGLVQRYFGKDIKEGKTRSDAWRLNFATLEPYPAAEWPPEAREYAVEDAIYAVWVHDAQEKERARIYEERGFDPFKVQDFRVDADLCLRLWSCVGLLVDAEQHARIAARVAQELTPEKLHLLYETGILRPAEAPRPHSNGARNHIPSCPIGGVGKSCNCPEKMTSGEPESMNTTVLKQFVTDLAASKPDQVTIERTAPSKSHPEGQISIKSEWLDEHSHHSPVLEQLALRASLSKLVTTELPRMCFRDESGKPIAAADLVHPLYDVLKETGRTSSYASKDYPSVNIQNIAASFGPDLNPRSCIVSPPGWLLFSIDYSYMELVTFAQTCLDLFGYSRLAEIINKGYDPHAWLGSQLLLRIDPEFESQILRPSNIDPTDIDAVYRAFCALKTCEDAEWRKTYKHWRTFAKPTGLGFPGGLGAETFVGYAKATYGVVLDLDTAKSLKDAWKEALPEAAMYFDYINTQSVDAYNAPRSREMPDGRFRKQNVYSYTTPLGMVRPNCSYCAAANGKGLQSPSAEGVLGAVSIVTRLAFDPAWGSPAYGKIKPVGLIHDEILGYVLDDGSAPEYCDIIAGAMTAAFAIVASDVQIKAVGVLMHRWDKAAEPIYGSDGRLIPWN